MKGSASYSQLPSASHFYMFHSIPTLERRCRARKFFYGQILPCSCMYGCAYLAIPPLLCCVLCNVNFTAFSFRTKIGGPSIAVLLSPNKFLRKLGKIKNVIFFPMLKTESYNRLKDLNNMKLCFEKSIRYE